MFAVPNNFWRVAGERAGSLGAEILRRYDLAREPGHEGVRGPSLRFLPAEIASLRKRPVPRFRTRAQRPQPVMLLPGFGAKPARMRIMREALAAAGHDVHDWGMGANLGPTQENATFLKRRVEALAQEHGAPVALVGWSLGGLFAREIAWRTPDSVSCVITMGSPFSGDLRANNVWRAYQAITGHSVDAPPIERECRGKPPVPTIALWSPRDGLVHPRSACGRRGERDCAIAVRCTHVGFASDPRSIAEVLRQLDLHGG